jgi:periplasmic copper chaperone A
VLAVLLLPGAGCSPAPAPEAGPLVVTDARVRAPIPGQDKTVGYFTARNAGAEDVVLSGAYSDAVRAIEMHVTLRDGDMVRMRRLEEVVIAPGETVRFEPGGRHLMLFGVSELTEPVAIVLQQQSGPDVRLPFQIIPLGEE